MQQSVLITGGAGYIGSVLVRLLLDNGFKVRVLDSLMFDNLSALESVLDRKDLTFIQGDIQGADTLASAVDKVHSVIHLAAIVGDPACARNPELVEKVNLKASRTLISMCMERGVERFLFASTCSNYGKQEGDRMVTENDELVPVSLYAETKVDIESFLLSSNRKDFCPCVFRLSTVFGLSPRMRFDLLVNEFTRDALLKHELVVFGEQFWRPYICVSDVARAFLLGLTIDATKIRGNTFNVGSNQQNFKKKAVVEIIDQHIPGTDVSYVEKDEDPRSYRVSFDKIHQQLGYATSVSVSEGVTEMKTAIEKGLFDDPFDVKYTNNR